ncbi:hypothetical protein AU374_04395 [Cupriavidus metallidurans]|jgi:hypothetical protein|nr:hypothetical protein AU374_04395 [Cupriavidus metallidurans]
MGEHPSTDDVFHRLVDCIYESAMDVAAMPAALDLFSRYTGTGSPSYLIWDKLAARAPRRDPARLLHERRQHA